jgi:hypothetical protein
MDNSGITTDEQTVSYAPRRFNTMRWFRRLSPPILGDSLIQPATKDENDSTIAIDGSTPIVRHRSLNYRVKMWLARRHSSSVSILSVDTTRPPTPPPELATETPGIDDSCAKSLLDTSRSVGDGDEGTAEDTAAAAQDFEIEGIRATSLFMLFEQRLTELRKVDEDQLNSSGSELLGGGSCSNDNLSLSSAQALLRRSRSAGGILSRAAAKTGSSNGAGDGGGDGGYKTSSLSRLRRSRTGINRRPAQPIAVVAGPSTGAQQRTTSFGGSSPKARLSSIYHSLRRRISQQQPPSPRGSDKTAVPLPAAVELEKKSEITATAGEPSNVAANAATVSLPPATPLRRRRRAAASTASLEDNQSNNICTQDSPPAPVASRSPPPKLPLREEMGANCKRLIQTGDPDILFQLLLNPSVDEHYDDYTRDYMLTYRYHMSESQFWERIRKAYLEWAPKVGKSVLFADECQQPSSAGPTNNGGHPSGNPEARVGQLWVLSDRDALKITIR